MAEIAGVEPTGPTLPGRDPTAFLRPGADGTQRLDAIVDNIHCAGCVATIEKTLRRQPGVREARVNLTTRRLGLTFDPATANAGDLIEAVEAKGYRLMPYDRDALSRASDAEGRALLRAMAVAGFAAGNVMLLSVAVWAGLASDMGPATRALMAWISALIALPAIAYAGVPFYRSALGALAGGRLNMDVPISLAVVLAAGMSLYQTATGGAEVYFDAAVTLLFFLLIGRYLDSRVRARARSVAENLLLLRAIAATVILADGRRRDLPIDQVAVGMRLFVGPGDRVPADGRVLRGRSDVDESLITGESVPRAIGPGDRVFAGALNLEGGLEIEVEATDEDSLLAEIARLVEAGAQGRARYVRLADRVARAYAPAVHVAALAAFLGWLVVAGAGWEGALMVAVAVLIVTCPCALGLAVPAVQVAAVGRLLRRGILVKSTDGLERVARVDTVVFDKTGTLTRGELELANRADLDAADLEFAARLARASRHPLARALVRDAGAEVAALAEVQEHPGEGLAARLDGGEARLGSARFCGLAEAAGGGPVGPELWLARPGAAPVRFAFRDGLRSDARSTIDALGRRGLGVALLSGDRATVVGAVAAELGIAEWRAECRPDDKARLLATLAENGRRVLMVGDGLNDAPALAGAFASISPASAADISQTAADFVFQGEALGAVVEIVDVGRQADRLVKQNFGLALAYNAIAVPLAMAGLVTPLIAAVAMSASSITVTANALRLGLGRRS